MLERGAAAAALVVSVLLAAVMSATSGPCHSGSFGEELDDYPAAVPTPLPYAGPLAADDAEVASASSPPSSTKNPVFSEGVDDRIIQVPVWRTCPPGQYMDKLKRCRQRF